jgi:hypothetical protein
MSELPNTFLILIEPPSGYADWRVEAKIRIHTAQQRAALAVNRQLVPFYWQIGRDILPHKAGARR